jgi:uncharacterized membrane protein
MVTQIKFILIRIIVLAIVFFAVDIAFLRMLTPYWNNQLMSIQGSPLKLNTPGALLSYATLIVGLYYFIIRHKKPVVEAMLLGWFVYLVYETTNKAIINNWKWQTVIIDGLWGGILFGLTTWVFYKVDAHFLS